MLFQILTDLHSTASFLVQGLLEQPTVIQLPIEVSYFIAPAKGDCVHSLCPQASILILIK